MYRVDSSISFTKFVYAFTFERSSFDRIVQSFANAQWQRSEGRDPFTVWRVHNPNVDELLPHIADYVNAPLGDEPTLVTYRLTGEAHAAAWGHQQHVRWALGDLPNREPMAFELAETDVYLFRTGAGFAVVNLRFPDDSTADAALDLNHELRLTGSRRRGRLTSERKVGPDEWVSGLPPAWQTLGVPEGPPDLRSALRLLLGSGSDNWFRSIYDEDYLVPFSALFLRAGEDDTIDTAELDVPIERCRRFARADQRVIPHGPDVAPSPLQFADKQLFTFSAAGGAFVAVDTTDSFSVTALPALLSDAYFPLFLLAHHQRVVLLELANHIARDFVPPEDAFANPDFEARVKALRRRVFEFTWRSLFSEVSQNEERQLFYARWREVLGVEGLFTEVQQRVSEINEALEGLHTNEQFAHMQRSLSHQVATTLALEIVEVGIAGVYLLEAFQILADNSGYHAQLVEHGVRLLGMPWVFWLALVVVVGTIPVLGHIIHRRRLAFLRKIRAQGDAI